jgi:hypothetical protein
VMIVKKPITITTSTTMTTATTTMMMMMNVTMIVSEGSQGQGLRV